MKNKKAYSDLHIKDKSFGSGNGHISYIVAFCLHLKPKTILDFGCGKGTMADEISNLIGLSIEKYDPALTQYEKLPQDFFDLLYNTDVLEHIPEEELPQLFFTIKKLSKLAILIPHLELSGKLLPDGSNVHCTIKSKCEWKAELLKYWSVVEEFPHHNTQHAIYVVSENSISDSYIFGLIKQIVKVEKEKKDIQRKTITGYTGRFLDIIGIKYYLRNLIAKLK